jgi:hypothetical protein
MSQLHDAWLAKQRLRWMQTSPERFLRPDAHRFIRPDAHRFFKPGAAVDLGQQPYSRKQSPASPRESADDAGGDRQAELDASRARWHLAALRVELALKSFEQWRRKAGFNPDQPRVPAGNPGGGQWTSEGGESSSLAPVDNELPTEFSASRRAKGHHYVPRAVYDDRSLPDETRRVFDEATTGKILTERHGWSKAHEIYNEQIGLLFDRFLQNNDIRPEQMTPDQARSFVKEVLESRDPGIRNFNMRIRLREILYRYRNILRRND